MSQHINICPIKSICVYGESPSMSKPAVVTDIVSDGTNWCIKYSDGWIEKGGYVSVSSMAQYGSLQVAFPSEIDGVNVAFGAIPSFISCTPLWTGTTNRRFSMYAVESPDTTGFIYRNTGNNNNNLSGFYWIAKGK